MKSFPFEKQRCILGRLSKGDDLLAGIKTFCQRNEVLAGSFTGLGALQNGCIGFYNQEEGKYHEVRFEEEMEIASLIGNVSQKEGDTAVHAHVVLADAEGRCFGGHLMEGNLVFACELSLTAVDGPVIPTRMADPDTGLMLW